MDILLTSDIAFEYILNSGKFKEKVVKNVVNINTTMNELVSKGFNCTGNTREL